MEQIKTPARRQPGQGLDFDARKSNSTKKYAQLPIGVNHKIILTRIAERWSAKGLYTSPSRAMIALLRGMV